MNWENSFEVEAPPDTVFRILLDIPTIAPCMPGAQLTGQDDEGRYEGTVKVKLGPITAQYRGKARLTETDESARRAVLLAEGSETRGQGTASATVTAVCTPAGEGTRVQISTDLKLTGKVAQFGRGVLQDVSSKLIGQFADCLATTVLGPADDEVTGAEAGPDISPDPAPDAQDAESSSRPGASAPAPAPAGRPTVEAIDLGSVAGGAVAKRVVPVLVGLLALVVLWRMRRQRR